MFHHSEQLLNCEGGNNKRTILLGGEEAKTFPLNLNKPVHVKPERRPMCINNENPSPIFLISLHSPLSFTTMAGPRKSGPPKAGEAPQRHSHCLPGSDLCKELGGGEVYAVPLGNASLPPSSFAHAASDRYEISPAPNLNVGLITRLCFSPNKVQVPQSLHQAQVGTMPVGKVSPSGVAPDRTEDRDPGDDIELPEGIIVDDYLSQ